MKDNIFNKIINCKDIKIDKNIILQIIEKFHSSITSNKNTFRITSSIDSKNNNGFDIDMEVFDNIFKNISEEKIFYLDEIETIKSDKLIYGKYYTSKGLVINICDGNTYTLVWLLLKNIIANNKCIFVTNGYMHGCNNLVFTIIEEILNTFGISDKYLLFETDNIKNILDNYANIDFIVAIGNKELLNDVKLNAKNEYKLSSYGHFNLYIENILDKDLLSKIISLDNVNVLVKDDITISGIDTIKVKDLDEAIYYINYSLENYASAIFTSNKDNASDFINSVKSNILLINTSPSIEQILDINVLDLLKEKTIIYPALDLKDSIEIDISEL